ncbi:ankyrin repeat-containing domain protein [Fusarium sp. MPI-SDFR-AT-0072]|nr:ankyrin repeat-containing domain protein [Fusarium sp. MPI-SDFR-AT-0072]
MKPSEKTARFLRDHKLNPEAKQVDRSDAIHLAVLDKRFQIVDELLTLYPKDCLNAKSRIGPKKGRTPLHNAAHLGCTIIVKSLLAKGAGVDARSWNKYTALILAAKADQSEIVNILVNHKANINAQTNAETNELSALHVAAKLESPVTILNLLLRGADPEVVTLDGDTPLHFAVRARCAPAAALLLFHGASATAPNKKGASPRSLLDNLPEGDQKRFEHIFDCATGERNFGALIPKYVDPTTPLDMTAALHWAVDQNLERAVAYLLHINPRAVEARNSRGRHPLHRAARSGFHQCVLVLLQHGADVDCKTKTGWTPLMIAAEMGYNKTCQILLEYNASHTAKNDDGNTAWQISRHCGHRLPALLGARHVPSSTADADEEDADDGRETEGELYALTDAIPGDSSMPSPRNPNHIEKFLASLELTWYNQVRWDPDDDIKGPGYREWHGPVKIAILDTGIDLDHEDFLKPARRMTQTGRNMANVLPEKTQRERIKACASFVGSSKQDVTDLHGHGTHIAGLILSIAPRAELYIAKVSSQFHSGGGERDEKPVSKKDRRESGHPVEEALKWAIDQRVDIINLSLGFAQESSYSLTKTLKDADHEGIIVFAAAANHGNRQAIAWPARDRDLAICVTSGDEYNHLSQFAPGPNRDLPVLITHGEDVCSHWPTNLGGGFRKMSGTSVSTPIAVGMAAMILAFLNSKNICSEKERRTTWLRRSIEGSLRSTRGMGRLLEHMCCDFNGLKVLSPKLMWVQDLDLDSRRVLSNLGQYEANR